MIKVGDRVRYNGELPSFNPSLRVNEVGTVKEIGDSLYTVEFKVGSLETMISSEIDLVSSVPDETESEKVHPNRAEYDIVFNDEVLIANHHKVYYESIFKAMEISAKKNHDYAGGMDKDPLANFKEASKMGLKPEQGLWMRSLDKVGRINTFFREGKLEVENEGLEDALMDLGNYCFLMLALLSDSKSEEVDKDDN